MSTAEALKKYPFLFTQGALPAGSLTNLGELRPLLPKALARSRQLLGLSLRRGLDPSQRQYSDEREMAALHALAFALVTATGNRRMIRAASWGFSKEVELSLMSDALHNPRGFPEIYIRVGKAAGIEAAFNWITQRFEMSLLSYLVLRGIEGDPKLMLPQLSLAGGKVAVPPNVFAAMVSRVLRYSLTMKLELQANELRRAELDPDVKAGAETLASEFSRRKGEEVDIQTLSPVESLFPPCVKFWASEMRRGVNVPHQARFLVATFLLHLDYSVDEVLRFFSTTPDYDEGIARYQVEDLAGEKGSGKKYAVPRCDTLRTLGACTCREGLCVHMTHPLLYYRLSIERKLNGDKLAGSECAGSLSRLLHLARPRRPVCP